MLGDKLGESQGRISGMRVLPSEGQQVYLEASFQGQGMLLGQTITDIGTYRQTMRDGALHGEGHVVMLTSDGALADWVGGGVGKPTGPGLSASYGVYGSFQSATGTLERLLAVHRPRRNRRTRRHQRIKPLLAASRRPGRL